MGPKARKRLVVAKANHLITRRPKEERRQIHDSVGIGPMTDVVTASKEIPLEQRIWTCRICAGLPHARHFQVCHIVTDPLVPVEKWTSRVSPNASTQWLKNSMTTPSKRLFPSGSLVLSLSLAYAACARLVSLASLNPLGSNPIGKHNLLTSAAATC